MTPASAGHPSPRRSRGGVIALEWREFMAKARQAMRGGASREGPVLHWNVSKGSRHPCDGPVALHSFRCAPKSAPTDAVYRADRGTALLTVYGRCRACPGCLRHRRSQWLARCLTEQAACQGRTWFVTLTSGEHHRAYIDMQARALAHKRRKSFDSLSPVAQFEFRAAALKRELALYLKRVRKGVGRRHVVRFRFVAVIEPHKDFQAHAHLLVFEQVELCLTRRLLCDRWGPRGFSGAKLVTGAAAAYVSKYLSKDRHAKVHASLRFGQPEASS